jgi:hypothetical protein
MYKLTPFNKDGQTNLSETFQVFELKMAFARIAGDSVDRIHHWVKCRDFLGDIIWATDTNTKKSIYGLTYDPVEDLPIEKDSLTLLLKFPDTKMLDTFFKNQSILDTLEKNNKQPSSVFYATNDEKIILVKASQFWQQNIPVLSFYTFILKVMCVQYENPVNWLVELPRIKKNCPETCYIKKLGKNLDILYQNCYNIFKDDHNIHGYPKNTRIDTVHNYSGFVSTCSGYQLYEINTHKERYEKYVANMGKTTKRAPRKSAKMVEALNTAAPACC